MVVVACNSSSSYAISALKRNYNIPILGVIQTGAKKAVEVTKNKKIGIIATSATINSKRYTKFIKSYNSSVGAYTQACPLFVPLAEEGWFNKII